MKLVLITATDNLSGHPAFTRAPLTPSFLDLLDHLTGQFQAFAKSVPELLEFHTSHNPGWTLVHAGTEFNDARHEALRDAMDAAGKEYLVLPQDHPLLGDLKDLATNDLHLVVGEGVALQGEACYDKDTYTSTYVNATELHNAMAAWI